VSVENWLAALLEKIKKHAEDGDAGSANEGEGAKWMTDLEEAVDSALKAGGGPSHDQTVEILKEEMCSPRARTRGFVLDLTFYKSPDSWAKIIRTNELLGPADSAGR